MNHTFKVSVKSPLLRPGLEINFEVSGKYLVPSIEEVLDKVREINTPKVKK